MITVVLDKNSAEDISEIEKLRQMGVPEDMIQEAYDNTVKARESEEREEDDENDIDH